MAHATATPASTAPPPAGKFNPEWIRAGFTIFGLSVLLRAGLKIPIMTTFVALWIIFLTHIVFTDMRTGVNTVWGWIKSAGNILMGLVIFLALRFVAAGVVGLYPIDTYDDIKKAGGLYGILPSRNISEVILWEVLFAFVAGGLTVAWIKGQTKLVGTIFGVSLLILTMQRVLPDYTKTWPNRQEVGTTLAEKGVVGATFKGAKVLFFGKPEPTPTPAPAVYNPPTSTKPVVAYVLVDKCTTPCTRDVKYDYRIRTDGDPIRIKYSGCPWVERPAKGEFTPSCFHPGMAEFASPDNYPNFEVEIQKKITVEGGR